jgi:hypothetical protein
MFCFSIPDYADHRELEGPFDRQAGVVCDEVFIRLTYNTREEYVRREIGRRREKEDAGEDGQRRARHAEHGAARTTIPAALAPFARRFFPLPLSRRRKALPESLRPPMKSEPGWSARRDTP